MIDRNDLACVTFSPLASASPELRAALYLVAPSAIGWRYLDSSTRTGAIVALPDGSKREIDARELNHAYALTVDAEPGSLPALAMERAQADGDAARRHDRATCTRGGQPGHRQCPGGDLAPDHY